MIRIKLLVLVFVVLALGMSFVSCSKPPEAEKESAKKAMDAAIAAGADQYAPTDLEPAKKLWDTAETQMKEKKYKEAKQSYIDAKAAFEKAAAGVEGGKKAVADQVNADLATLEGAWKNLDATAKKMERKMKDKDAWTNDTKTISEGLTKAKEMAVSDPAGAKTKMDEVKGMMDKWDDAIREMAAAPTPAPAKPEASKKAKK